VPGAALLAAAAWAEHRSLVGATPPVEPGWTDLRTLASTRG